MKNYLFILLVAISLSCTKEEYNFDKLTTSEFGPELAVPVIHSSLALKDLLKSTENAGFLREDSDGFLSIVYRSTAFSKKAKDIIIIPNQAPTAVKFDFPLPNPFPPIDTFNFPYANEFLFITPNKEKLDSLIMKSGTLGFTLNTNINYKAKIKVSSSQMTKNGKPLELYVDYDPSNSTASNTINMAGYKISFPDNDSNKVNVVFSITAYNNPLATDLSPYVVNLGVTFNDIQFLSIYGYMGTQGFSVSMDTLSIDLFKNNIEGSYKIGDPRINIYLTNSIGVPMKAAFTTFSAVNGSMKVDIAGQGLPNPWYINSPTKPGKNDTTNLHLNQTSCNILNVLDISPKHLYYQVQANFNPNGYVTQNFILDTSSIDLDLEVELPMYGSVGGFVMQDTVAMDMNDVLVDVDMIDYVDFFIRIKNGFPLEVASQIYFVDESYKKLDSLFTERGNIIEAAPPGPEPKLKPQVMGIKLNTISISNAKLQRIKNTKYLMINAKLSSYKKGAVLIKIYSDYVMDVKLGIKTKLKVKI